MHELVHLDFAVRCRKESANYLFVSTKEQKEQFIRNNEAVIQRLNSEGMDDDSIAGFINSLFNGMNSQIYNNPVDLFIEDFLYKTYPELRPFQFVSLYALLQDYIKSATSKKIIEYAPATVRNANIILSLVHSFQFHDLYGYETSNLFKASQLQMKIAKAFYDEYRKYQKKDMALESHQLIEKWAKELKIEKYFTLVEESEYRSRGYGISDEENSPLSRGARGMSPTLEKGGKGGFEQLTPSPLAGEGKGEGDSINVHSDPAGQAAVTMYCLSALQYFADKDLEEIKKVGFEIAMLGRQGIDPAKPDKKYHLESIPDKEFSGLHLLAYMYSAFQVIDPFLDTGMNYKKEYEAANGMFKGKI